MKANELRIGNICHKRNGVDCVTIDVIDISQLVKWEETNYSEIPPLLPIPLTEEWLLRMGYWYIQLSADKSYKKYAGGSGKIRLNVQTGCISIVLTGRTSLVNYVHQMQNIHFALTGEELTIKEE